MKPKQINIEHIAEQDLYSVYVKKKVYYPEIWGEKERLETETESTIHAVGDLKDIQDYFKLKYPNRIIEVEKVSLDYKFRAAVITPDLGKKSRELRDLEKKVKKESRDI